MTARDRSGTPGDAAPGEAAGGDRAGEAAGGDTAGGDTAGGGMGGGGVAAGGVASDGVADGELARPGGVTAGVAALGDVSPARRYREIVAGIGAAADALRGHDRQRAAVLARRLGELDRAMLHAGERAALSRLGVALNWEAALEALWTESWLRLRPLPEPDPAADPAELDRLDAMVQDRTDALRAAVRRRFPLPGH